jgi:hypothetical protein
MSVAGHVVRFALRSLYLKDNMKPWLKTNNINTRIYISNKPSSDIQVWCDGSFEVDLRWTRRLITSILSCARARRVRALQHRHGTPEASTYTWIAYIACYSQVIGLFRTVIVLTTQAECLRDLDFLLSTHTNLASLDYHKFVILFSFVPMTSRAALANAARITWRGTRLGVLIPEGWQGAPVRAATKRRQTGQRGAVRIVLAELRIAGRMLRFHKMHTTLVGR